MFGVNPPLEARGVDAVTLVTALPDVPACE
jgi:hypothetical protein